MNSDTKNTVTFYPSLASTFLILFGCFLFYFDYRIIQIFNNPVAGPNSLFVGYPYVIIGTHIYFIYKLIYFFVYAPIKITGDKLVIPITSSNGVPSRLSWGKIAIDIKSIRKINEFRADVDTLYHLRSFSIKGRITFGSLDEEKIVIVYGDSAQEVSIKFYSWDNITLLIDCLCQLNEKIEVADRGR